MTRFAFLALAVLASTASAADKEKPKVDAKIYELRIYSVLPGRMKAMNDRFRDHTNKLFVKHGITLVGYWQPHDPKEHDKKLIYIIAHANKEAAARNWKAFREDPAWIAVRTASEKDGKIVSKVDSTYMDPTDYSLLK